MGLWLCVVFEVSVALKLDDQRDAAVADDAVGDGMNQLEPAPLTPVDDDGDHHERVGQNREVPRRRFLLRVLEQEPECGRDEGNHVDHL